MKVSVRRPNPIVRLRNGPLSTSTSTMATTTMSNIEGALGSVISALSEGNYEQSLAQYRFLFEIAQAHSQIPSDLIFNSIWQPIRNREIPSDNSLGISYPTSPLILRFASDAESDTILAPHCAGLQSRLCTGILTEFFDHWLGILYREHRPGNDYLLDANLIAHGVNLGYIEETVIRNHILQFLTDTSRPTPYTFQGFALCVLLKIAGATFEAYTDSSVIDRCFEFLKARDSSGKVYLQQLKVGGLYEEDPIRANSIAGGGNSTTGTGLGGSASPTHLHNQGTRARNRHGQGRSYRNSCPHISGTTKHGPRTSGPSVPSP